MAFEIQSQSRASTTRLDVDGMLNVLNAAWVSSIERVVMALSSSVYGGRKEYLPFSEMDLALPVSPYGSSKFAAERYLCSYHEVYDLPEVVLRYFTVNGPGVTEYGHLELHFPTDERRTIRDLR